MGSERVDIGAGGKGLLRQVESEGACGGACGWGCVGMGLRCGEGDVRLVRWRDSRHVEKRGDGFFRLVC